MDHDLLTAEGIFAVGHTRGPQGVGYQDDPLLPKELEGGPDYAGMDVNAVADQLRPDLGVVKGSADDAWRAVGEGRHSVEQVGGLPGAGLIGGAGGVVVGGGVADGHGDAVLPGGADKLQRAGLFRGHGDQLHKAVSGLLEPMEHGAVGIVKERAVLGALLGHTEERPFQVQARQLRAACGGGPVSCRILTDAGELVLRQRHAGRADVSDALTELVIGHALEPVRGSVAEILSHAAVEVDVDQTGNDIAARGVQRLAVAAGGGKKGAVGAYIPLHEALFQVKDLTAGYSHTGTPAAASLLKAALSPTSTTSL